MPSDRRASERQKRPRRSWGWFRGRPSGACRGEGCARSGAGLDAGADKAPPV